MAEAALNIEQATQPEVLVLGIGMTGASCARYLAARGAVAVFADSRETPPGVDAVLSAMPEAVIQRGALPDAVPEGIATVVVSPGMRLPEALLQDAAAKEVSVVSDIDLFLAEEAGSVLLVTGSNGKSTVTSLVNHLLTNAGRRSVAGGNLGVPALDLLKEPHDIAVLELSSFQLERSSPPISDIAVILNFAVDHIDQHGSLDAYRAAKLRIYDNCAVAVVNRGEPELGAGLDPDVPVVSFGTDEPEAGSWGLRDSMIVCGERAVMPVSDVPLFGKHNLQNVLAAFAIVSKLGVSDTDLVSGLKQFASLPHRMQLVAEAAGVVWINDSKATNDAAAAASVASTEGPLVLIAGGDGKGSHFDDLAGALQGRDALAFVYGQDAALLQGVLAPVCHVERVDDLAQAVKAAGTEAKAGMTVLLAPACASQDMFANFAERGDCFAALVAEQIKSGGVA